MTERSEGIGEPGRRPAGGERSESPEPEPETAPEILSTVRIRPYLQAALAEEEAEPEADTGELPTVAPVPTGLRPFVLTSGRVAGADPAIGLETQVTARIDGMSWTSPPVDRLSSELQEIVALCVEPMSVAEISARLRMHLGVTKILVGDLRAAGHLDVHVCAVEDAHDPDLIMRVIDGLRAIS
ncbi:DUF742 domain-containing protein [Plantactinospora endophytica]|uniref:DUF742 domain-containing protein n=1 Tax=Plantactinospora endophytica TaxID=673535 RepID=A0ABQ4DSD6_9ACTN|nr:DUF742 domain-containing protein [Plantactinospora endophytica]GIG85356.1 hypothetical protein Pen02_02920 [Plantactinospora endophytica]